MSEELKACQGERHPGQLLPVVEFAWTRSGKSRSNKCVECVRVETAGRVATIRARRRAEKGAPVMGAPRRVEAPPAGTQQGLLTVVKEVRGWSPSGRDYRALECTCSCTGEVVEVPLTDFVRKDGKAKQSCGCVRSKARKGKGRKHEVGVGQKQPTGRLTVVEVVYRGSQRAVVCDCECGGHTEVRIDHFLKENVRSCGCLNREVARERMKAREPRTGEDHPNFKNGLARQGVNRHPLYRRWNSMMQRCYNEKDPAFARYGGRGIKVHESWHDSASFVAWIEQNLGPCPQGYSLDRWDNDGNYAPDNVRWASPQDQARNQWWSHKERDDAAQDVVVVLRDKFPGHSQSWYVTYMKRVSLQAVGVPLEDLPELPDK